MSGLYATDGSVNVTVVDGSAQVGHYAPDGSMNVIVSDGSNKGLRHTCGAIRVTLATTQGCRYAPDGSYYVKKTPYTSGPVPVTVVAGVGL